MKTNIFLILALSISLSAHSQENQTADTPAPTNPVPTEADDSGLTAKDIEVDLILKDFKTLTPNELIIPKAKPLPPDYIDKKVSRETIRQSVNADDVVTLQKIYLRKTKRLGVNLGFLIDPSNPFFYSGGLHASLSYNLTEMWGAEVFAFNLSSTETEDLKNLSRKYKISGRDYIFPVAMNGARLNINPWYGKVALNNKKIIPFDLFFTVGGGLVTSSRGENSPGFELSFGQLVTIGRSLGIRWDLMYIAYQDSVLGAQDTFLVGFLLSDYYPKEVTR